MKIFKQTLLLSTFLALPFHAVWGMKDDNQEMNEKKGLKFPTSLSKRFANNIDKETFNGIRKSIENQIRREEKTPKNPICVDALFLGPHAENAEMFKSFIKDALNDHLYWRRSFHPEDPFRITEEIKNSSDFLRTKDSLAKNLRLLLAELKKYSNPLFSFRYQAHMYWEMTIPSLVGYIATILYNPNNVAFEGSPVTMCLEEQVAKDLCKMVGYSTEEIDQEKNPLSWGHLTGGGTIANTEALWVARNIKFFPFSIQQVLKEEALKEDSPLKAAEKVEVTLPDGKLYPFTSLDPWTLLNIESDEILKLPEKIFQLLPKKKNEGNKKEESIITFTDLYERLSKYSIQEKGLLKVYKMLNKLDPQIGSPVVLISATGHYSFPKAVSLLGLGETSLKIIPVDINARINTKVLEEAIDKYKKKKRPIIAVAAIIGSTEESAIDPLGEIVIIRDKFKEKGVTFHIHADAAWGGYFATLIDKEESKHIHINPFVPQIDVSDYVTRQLKSLKWADSVTIDPHKSGYMPYPAGALCYRNGDMKNMINFTAPYLWTEKKSKEPEFGVYGIEGSKPGASAAMVYLTHRVIPLDKNGYGVLLGQALFSTKDLYRQILALNTKENKKFIVVPLPQDPKEEVLTRIDSLRRKIIKREKEQPSEIQKEKLQQLRKELNEEFKQIGPDLNILAYAFNFFDKKGNVNTNLNAMNEFNQTIYKKLRPQFHKPASQLNLIVSHTSLDSNKYGSEIVENFLDRLKVEKPSESYSVTTLRSVMMNPWITETETGSFVDTIIKELTQTVKTVLKEKKQMSNL